jgi:lipid II:glycine glycyltransferase (peptidoglycan interpeptide bridge formation enzyme)
MSAHPPKTAFYSTREVEAAGQEEWDRWMANSPGGGHIFQTHRWGELKRTHGGWRPVRLLLERGGEVVGAGQFLLRSTAPIPGKIMYASKGPWLPWDDEDAVKAFFDGASEIARREGAHTLKIEPEIRDERDDLRGMLEGFGFQKARYDLNFDATILMDLSPDEDGLFSNMSGKKGKTTRYNIRRSAKEGVEVREPEDFDWAFDKFYEWTEALARRKEGVHIVRPRQYFYDETKMLHESGHGHFFFAFHEGEPLSGGYFSKLGNKLYYMLSASAEHGQDLHPNYALQWEVMRWAKGQGVTLYDMVAAPKRENRNENDPYYGVYKFKMGFGGEVVDFIGCMDLPVKPGLAALWYRLEPLYYRAYFKLKKSIFY